MTLLRSLCLLALATLLLPCAPAAASVPGSVKGGLEYVIRVPADFDPRVGARVVFVMHGRGDSHTRVMRVAESEAYLKDAILVSPSAPKNLEWNQGDRKATAQLIDVVRARYHVTRTIMFGFSSGGFFAFSMGMTYPEKIQAVIPHSGGLWMQVPETEGVKNQVYAIIHGDKDKVVPVGRSRTAIEKLKAVGATRIHYRELAGLGHMANLAQMLSSKASKDAFKWIETTLGSAVAPLGDREAGEAIAAAEEALKAKNWAAAAEAFGKLNARTARRSKSIAGLVKKALRADDEDLALAAIAAAGHLGSAGVKPLKSVSKKKNETLSSAAALALAKTHDPKALKLLFGFLKGKSEPVALAAAEALGLHGGLVGAVFLIKGLKASKSEARAERRAAILAALERISGESFESDREWMRWYVGQA